MLSGCWFSLIESRWCVVLDICKWQCSGKRTLLFCSIIDELLDDCYEGCRYGEDSGNEVAHNGGNSYKSELCWCSFSNVSIFLSCFFFEDCQPNQEKEDCQPSRKLRPIAWKVAGQNKIGGNSVRVDVEPVKIGAEPVRVVAELENVARELGKVAIRKHVERGGRSQCRARESSRRARKSRW